MNCKPKEGIHFPQVCRCESKQSDPVKTLSCPHCYMGVMTLLMGSREVQAPCLSCSPNENLNDLLRKIEQAKKFELLQKERKRIRDHNERIGESNDPPRPQGG